MCNTDALLVLYKPIIGTFKATNPMPNDPVAERAIQEIANFTYDIRFLAGKANP